MQYANGTANVFNLIFQIPTSVVTAGGIPTSAIGRSVANFSGHILKLVPGDFNYAFPLFPIVIIWNGETKFTPTQFTRFLGGLSLPFNHLIASRTANYDWPFGTLPFRFFG